MTELTVGFWNMLADGLAEGEFMTADPSLLHWKTKRGAAVVDKLAEMFQTCDLIGVVENDHFFQILRMLNEVPVLHLCTFKPPIYISPSRLCRDAEYNKGGLSVSK